MPLHNRILLGLTIGVVTGVASNIALGPAHPTVQWIITQITNPIGQLFLRLLLLTVVPLVFASLVSGIAGIGDVRKLGRVGLKSFAYTFAISAISVVIALTAANVIRPGKRVAPETAAAVQAKYGADAAQRAAAAQAASTDAPLLQVIKTLVPSNPLAAAAADPPNMLHVMFFALLLGVALTLVPEATGAPLLHFMESLAAVSTRIIELIMHVAPWAIACLLFSNTASFGLDLLSALLWYMATVLGGLAIHMFGVYSLALRWLAHVSPLDFFRRIRTVMLTAFATSSSNATLPTSLKVGVENLGIPPQINTFVLTIGATANQNGTALYEGVTVLFLAQLAGVELSIGQQIMVAYLAILGGIGTAGVPSGSIPFIVVVLATVGINPALIAMILGVDRILDMCRTTLNVVGDLTVAAYVAHSEGHELCKTPLVE
jgi:dicarboxylate/amino acid:cation (Na+ or H+) symporter, DAACS family